MDQVKHHYLCIKKLFYQNPRLRPPAEQARAIKAESLSVPRASLLN